MSQGMENREWKTGNGKQGTGKLGEYTSRIKNPRHHNITSYRHTTVGANCNSPYKTTSRHHGFIKKQHHKKKRFQKNTKYATRKINRSTGGNLFFVV